MKNWFEVSKEGLRELQEGKPKHFIARELIQNAWDEQTVFCIFQAEWRAGKAAITIIDDNPNGFKNLSDAFTLFQHTDKRSNPLQRGRYNIGEKQVLSICDEARIATTKGTVLFDKKGRHIINTKRTSGSTIDIIVKMAKYEFDEMLSTVKRYLVPENIKLSVNEAMVYYREPYKVIQATLQTENEVDGIFRRVNRKADIHILKTESPTLYEMGIPVCGIECKFDIDVQQKIPLSIDRETVSESYLKALYAEVLNATYEDIEVNESSQTWIRQATSNSRITNDAVKEIIDKRYGDKVVIANPFDKNSIDEAISSGYNVVYGSEMSKEEWDNVKRANAIQSSTALFGKGIAECESIEPNESMKKVAILAKKIARRLLNIEIGVYFYKSIDACEAADFGNKNLSFNVSKLGVTFFEPIVSSPIIDLIIHELGHYAGNHTEMAYHKLLTKMAGQLIIIALHEPEFFEID